MSGRARLPGGEVRKASQKRTRRAPQPLSVVELTWRAGDRVQWRDYTGSYLRDVDEDQADIMIDERTYRVAKSDLRPALAGAMPATG